LYLHPFLTSAADGNESSNLQSSLFIAGEGPWYPLNVRLGAPHNRPGRFGEEMCVLILPGFEPGTIQPVA
jgi:hypothetical protein